MRTADVSVLLSVMVPRYVVIGFPKMSVALTVKLYGTVENAGDGNPFTRSCSGELGMVTVVVAVAGLRFALVAVSVYCPTTFRSVVPKLNVATPATAVCVRLEENEFGPNTVTWMLALEEVTSVDRVVSTATLRSPIEVPAEIAEGGATVNARSDGDNIPVPLSITVCGVSGALSDICSSALRGPTSIGTNATLKKHCAPTRRGSGQLVA